MVSVTQLSTMVARPSLPQGCWITCKQAPFSLLTRDQRLTVAEGRLGSEAIQNCDMQ